MTKDVDLHAVIDRLRFEVKQHFNTLREIELVLRSDPEFDGLSILGGVKALLKALYTARSDNYKLKEELKKLMNAKP